MQAIVWAVLLALPALLTAGSNEDLLAAARKGDLAAVKTQLEQGAFLEATTSYGQTPLYLAAMSGHADVVRFLLEKGANTEVKDTFYKAPMLVFVVQRKQYGVAKLLITGAKVAPDLSLVASTGRPELMQAALDRGKPSQLSLDKAYEQALDGKQTEIAELLKKAGAQPPAPPMQVDAKILEGYAGNYKAEQIPLEIKVSIKDGKLYIQSTGQPEFAPKPKSATVFEFPPARLVVQFDSPDSFTLTQANMTFKFKKAVAK